MVADVEPFQPGRLTGPVKVFAKLVESWNLSDDDASVFLGFEPADKNLVRSILEGRTTLRGRDAKDRITSLYVIWSILTTMFGDAVTATRWMSERQRALGDKSPITLLKEGSMENLLRVKHLVEFIAGHVS
ncbi:MAG: hypothetical protein A3G24_25215 [Betaproteobacteria bacterium RIFCSPLOWO2_12_FULL_62_13]|nr:MAG: hypothetical protein A3G24_25215 [Betaproteobacteria bacterium RIFCSPLOWO2_12_FULL_62_13]